MKLSGFSVNEDFVSVRHAGRDLDLHNNYQFVELRQSVPQATVVLRWLRDCPQTLTVAVAMQRSPRQFSSHSPAV